MASRQCWHCHIYAGMDIVGKPQRSKIFTKDPIFWFALMVCRECGWPSICLLEGETVDDVIANGGKPLDAMDAEEEYVRHTWLPLESVGKQYEDVPEFIASAASEAYSCASISMYRAAVLMARTALEATAKDKGITEGTLCGKIKEMAKKHIITDQLADEADEIRLLGNDMAHGDLSTPVTMDDSTDILGFLDSVLDYVYQQPKAILRRQELRKARKDKD